MSQSDVLTHIELPPATGVNYCSVDGTSHMQPTSELLIDEPLISAGQPEPQQSELPSSKSTKKPIMDGEGHVCTKASVNPFFNLLRLYRSLPEAKGKTAPQVAIEGARIWKAMTQTEKNPFQQAAIRESKRRMHSREKRSKSTNDSRSYEKRFKSNDPKGQERRSDNRRSKEMKKVSGRSTKVH